MSKRSQLDLTQLEHRLDWIELMMIEAKEKDRAFLCRLYNTILDEMDEVLLVEKERVAIRQARANRSILK